MKTLEAINIGSELLKKKKIDNYILDSEILLSKTLNKSREEILINLDKQINEEELLIEDILVDSFHPYLYDGNLYFVGTFYNDVGEDRLQMIDVKVNF